MLGIDLPTFVFQIVNFLVLLAILARFFYRPLMRAVAHREALIESRLAEADSRAAEAEAVHEGLARERQHAAAEGEQLRTAAKLEAVQDAGRIIADAREEAARIISAARAEAARESEVALKGTEAMVVDSAVGLAQAVLGNVAGQSLDDALFSRGGREWPEAMSDELVAGLRRAAVSGGPIVVDVARAIEPAHATIVRDMIRRRIPDGSPEPEVVFKVDPEIIAGCRIHADDFILDLSLADALQAIRKSAAGGTE